MYYSRKLTVEHKEEIKEERKEEYTEEETEYMWEVSEKLTYGINDYYHESLDKLGIEDMQKRLQIIGTSMTSFLASFIATVMTEKEERLELFSQMTYRSFN